MSGWDEIKRQITESQVWQSIFRHGYDDTPRNRILMVSGNVWLHLHPSKVRRHATRLRFTWCMGGITFLLYLVTVVTGIYLMFYYRPTWDQLSIWAVTVGSNMGRATPILGHEGPGHELIPGLNNVYDARAFLFGGGEIGPHTLLRFYILHCIFIPLVASLFMAVHF